MIFNLCTSDRYHEEDFITTSNIFFFFFIYVTRPANLIINHTSISSPGFSHTFITDIYYRDRYHCLWVYVTDFPKTSSAVYNLCRPLYLHIYYSKSHLMLIINPKENRARELLSIMSFTRRIIVHQALLISHADHSKHV